MSVKKQLKNPLIQQYILEILLPIVGYFFFDWSLNIIAAFYLTDYACSEIARNRRVYKVYKNKNDHQPTWFGLSLIGGLTLFIFTTWWVWKVLSVQEVDYEPELIAELTAFAKEELWLLFPIVYLVYHMKDVMTFYMTRKFTKYHYKRMAIYQLIELAILTALVFSGTLLWIYTDMADVPVLISFIVIKIGYDILVARTLEKKYRD